VELQRGGKRLPERLLMRPFQFQLAHPMRSFPVNHLEVDQATFCTSKGTHASSKQIEAVLQSFQLPLIAFPHLLKIR
jgi:hypothetical protein